MSRPGTNAAIHAGLGRSGGPAARQQRGWALLVLSLILLLASSMATVAIHRLVADRDRAWAPQWAMRQAQALGHGGLMWTLARLEDPRPVDAQCRPVAGPAGSGFAQQTARPGSRVACDVDLQGPLGPAGWRCGCDPLQAAPAAPASPNRARLDLEFIDAPPLLKLRVTATVVPPGGASPMRWQESILLRPDAALVWRAVVGSWTDER